MIRGVFKIVTPCKTFFHKVYASIIWLPNVKWGVKKTDIKVHFFKFA